LICAICRSYDIQVLEHNDFPEFLPWFLSSKLVPRSHFLLKKKKRLPELFHSLAVCLIVFCDLLRLEDLPPYLIGLAIKFPTAGGAMLKP
jgi:hypothetical protein